MREFYSTNDVIINSTASNATIATVQVHTKKNIYAGSTTEKKGMMRKWFEIAPGITMASGSFIFCQSTQRESILPEG